MSQFQQSDLTYLGAFKVPGQDAYAYAQGPIEYNPANDSLYIVGHTYNQRVAEINIPQIVNTTSLAALKTATIRQNLIDPLEGQRNEINPGNTNNQIGGLLIHEGELYVSAFTYYDGSASATKSHFKRPLNLSTTGQVVGAWRVNGSLNPGFIGGYMCAVPVEYQAAIGKPALTGNNSLSIITRTSWGPAAFGFDPSDIGSIEPVQTADLVYYSYNHPTLGAWNATSSVWNGSAIIQGILFPRGYESVLFFGRQGTGSFCYGGAECNDPTSSNQGIHAYPYVYQVWRYDVNDLIAARNGTKLPWEPLPTTWTFTLPFQWQHRILGGVAYDAVNNRLFLLQQLTAGNGFPLIHVFQIREVDMPKTVAVATQITTVPAGDFKVKTQLLDLTDTVIDEATSQPFSVPADPPSTPNVETPTVTVS